MAKDAELKLVLNTAEAIKEAKQFNSDLEKALSVQGALPGVEKYQKALKAAADSSNIISDKTKKLTGAFNAKNLDQYDKKLSNAVELATKLEGVNKRLAELGVSGTSGLNSLKGKIGAAVKSGDAEKETTARANYSEAQELLKQQTVLATQLEQEKNTVDSIAKKVATVTEFEKAHGKEVEKINAKYDEAAQKSATSSQEQTSAIEQSATAQKNLEQSANGLTSATKQEVDNASALKEKLDQATNSASELKEQVKSAEAAPQSPLNSITGTAEEVNVNTDPAKMSILDLVSTLAKLDAKYRETESVVSEFNNRLNGNIPTTQTTADLNKGLDETKKELETVAADSEKFKTALDNALSADTANMSIAELVRHLQELSIAQKSIEKAGMPSSVDAYYNKIYDAIQRTKGAISDYKRELNGVDESHEKASSSGINFGKALKKASSIGRSALNALKAVINKIISGLKSAIKSVGKVINNIRSHFSGMAKDMNRNFKHLITNITKYVFGFRSLFFLVRRLRSQIKEGFQNLVQFNGGVNDVNYAISAILSSLLFLKNAWAAAFSPIVTFVQGWLTALIDKLAEVGNAIARFIGALTGQAIVFNAVKVDAGDYAKSLSDVGGSAGGAAKKTKQLTDRLAAFDDLNVLGKDKDPSGTGSGGGGGAGDASALDPNEMFKIVDVTQNFKDMLKDAWANADFTEIGSIIGDKLVGVLNNINWGSIKQTAYNIGKSIITFINGALSDGALWTTVGQTFAEGFNTLGEFASGILQNNTTDFGGGFAMLINSFVTNFDWETFKSNLQTFFETLKDNINSFFSTLDLSTITVELSSLSESLTTSIVSLIDGINWEQVISSASEIGGAILDGIQQGLVSSDNPVLQSIGEFMGTARETIGEFISSLGAAFSSIGDVLATLEPILGPLKEALSGVFDSSRESFGKLLEQLPELMPSISSIIESLGSFYENLMTIIGGLIPVFVQLSGALTPFMSLMSDLITAILPVMLSLFDALSPILTTFSDSIVPVLSEGLELIKPVLEKISEFLSAIFSVAGDLIANFLELAGSIMEQLMPALEPFSDILSIIFDIFTDLFEPVSALIEPLMEVLEVALEPMYIVFDLLAASLKISVVPMFKLLSGFIKAVVVPWITILVNGIKGLIDIFHSLSTVIKIVRAVFKEGFNAIKNAVYTAVNAILGFMESLANGIVRGINKAIDGINSLNFTIPDWVPEVGGNSVGFHLTKLSTISIPRLAQGAVIPPNKEFMAILGDQTSGTNIEAPLDVIKQAVAEELSAQLEVLQDGFNSVVTAINNKNLNIGDKEIGKANARYLNQQRLIRGTSI